MDFKIGTDIVLNKRINEKIPQEEFLKKVFQISELKDKTKLISIFSLKEATMKALGEKIDWLLIEVSYKDSKPLITLNDSIKPKSFKSIQGSVSHDGDYTLAFVVLELKD